MAKGLKEAQKTVIRKRRVERKIIEEEKKRKKEEQRRRTEKLAELLEVALDKEIDEGKMCESGIINAHIINTSYDIFYDMNGNVCLRIKRKLEDKYFPLRLEKGFCGRKRPRPQLDLY